jgi:hypothetical protein
MIKWNESTDVNVWSAMVSQFVLDLPPKIVQVTIKHDPFNVMLESM